MFILLFRKKYLKNIYFLVLVVIFSMLYLQHKLTLLSAITPVVEKAELIHFTTLVVDAHSDTLTKILDYNWFPRTHLGKSTPYAVDIPKLQAGGINVQFFAVYVPERHYPGQTISRTLALINGLYHTLEQNPYTIGLAKSPAGINHLVGDGKIAAVASIEGADSLKEPHGLELLRQYYDLGIRVVGFTWNDSNQLAEGYSGTYHDHSPSTRGITPFGREMIGEMNQFGILIDVSHLPEASFWDVLAASKAPVIASHSGVYTLRKHYRNLTDDQILAIADRGGVVQILFHVPFLAYPGAPVSAATVVDHIDYVVKLAGIDHVGLGSDFDGGRMPGSLKDASMYPVITAELLRRGYGQPEIEKILGKNTLRVITQVWQKGKEEKEGKETALGILPLNPVSMGQVLEQSYPLHLAAQVSKNNEQRLIEASFQVIVDGKNYPYRYDEKSGTLSAIITKPLGKGFHVVTFVLKVKENHQVRQAIIFYSLS